MSARWKKLGKIYDPHRHPLPFAPAGFAQSPQALVLQDRVRVYFSARAQDELGKFVSHVGYADFTRDFSQLLGVSPAPAIELGGLGTFDEHGIFPFNVLRDGDRVLAFTTGWNRRKSVPTDAAIGLAISTDDGLSFQKCGAGPVLAPGLHEPFLVGDAFVLRAGGALKMWYIHGTRWMDNPDRQEAERVYKIAQATSTDDGMSWKRDGRQIITDRLGDDECQALPTVIEHDGRYHMVFCYREATDFRNNPARAYRLGHAWSTDLVNWTRDDAQWALDRSEDGWDSEMLCYPHLCRVGDQIYLLYNGNKFGRDGFGVARLET